MSGNGGLTIRPVGDEEFATWARAVELPFFGDDLDDDTVAQWRAVTEPERTLATFDGDQIVGTAATFTFRVTVPGGELGMGGLTAVGVHPTHRRRGVLTAMMRRQLDDVAERGEPLAGLYAAEAPIYGRFGYGSSAPVHSLQLDRGASAFRGDVVTESGVQLVGVDEALRDFPAIHDRARATRSGWPDRDAARWKTWLSHDDKANRDGYSRRYLARLGDRGYVVYRVKGDWTDGVPTGRLRVLEHVACDPVAAATLWRYCCDVDLVATVELGDRPVDDTLPLLLADSRRLQARASDALWLRLVRAGEALAGRRYAAEGALVLDIADGFCPANAGRWRLESGHDGQATCRRTDADPDLSLGTADLAAAYLGAVGFARLRRAGLLDEHTGGAAARADVMFRTDPAPWCPQVF